MSGRTFAASTLFCMTLASAPAVWSRDRNIEEGRKISSDYAMCVVRLNSRKASEALLANVDNGQLSKYYSRLIDGNCLSSAVELRFSSDLYRYALADALINSEYFTDGPDNFSDRLPLAHLAALTQVELDTALAAEKSEKKRAKLEERLRAEMGIAALSLYGECVVRFDPRNARLWVLTKPTAPEEGSRIDALSPAFSACLHDGTTKFSKSAMRGTVALNYYRLAHAIRQPSSVKVN